MFSKWFILLVLFTACVANDHLVVLSLHNKLQQLYHVQATRLLNR